MIALLISVALSSAQAMPLPGAGCVRQFFVNLGIIKAAAPAASPEPTLVERLGVDPARALQVYYGYAKDGRSALRAGCRKARGGGYGKFQIESIEDGSLDLLILTDTRPMNYQRTLSEIVGAMKMTMAKLSPEGRILLVNITENIGDDFSRAIAAADALGLRHERVTGRRQLFIFR